MTVALQGERPAPAAESSRRRGASVADWAAFLPALCAGAASAWWVGTRGLDVGTDTRVYAEYFLFGSAGTRDRVEPGFLLVTRVLRGAGMELTGYQACLYVLLLAGAAITVRTLQWYLAATERYAVHATASLAALLMSPVYASAAVNVIRQGLASVFVVPALIAFRARRWGLFLGLALLASALHYSSIVFLACAPLLLVGRRWLVGVVGVAACAYLSGGTMRLIEAVAPQVYLSVIEYGAAAEYRSGVRIDFAVFSYAVLAVLAGVALTVKPEVRRRFREALAVYAILLVPFFMLGWGGFSDRLLLAPWLYASFLLGAAVASSHSRLVRDPKIARVIVLLATGAFYWHVGRMVVV